MLHRYVASDKHPMARTNPVGRIDPRHEARARHLGSFRLISVAHGHSSAFGLPSMVARVAHAGSSGDRGLSSAISRRILANSVLGTAISAISKATALAANDHLAYPVAIGATFPMWVWLYRHSRDGVGWHPKSCSSVDFWSIGRLSDGGSQVQGVAGPQPAGRSGRSAKAGRFRRMVLPSAPAAAMVRSRQATAISGPRRRSIRRKIAANSAPGTATSASWKMA